MFKLITGGSGSGKSAYAENCVLSAGKGRRIYIATMIPYGEDGKQRIERHRRLRSQKQFETVECYTDLKSLVLPPDSIVLLECLSNLVANELFEPSGAGRQTEEEVLRGIESVRRQASHLFVVTNEVFSDGLDYSEETLHYLSVLGAVNQRLAEEADAVVEVVYGIPVAVRE